MLQFVRLGRIENCGRIVPTTLANPLHTPAGHDALKDVQPEANDFTTHTHAHKHFPHTGWSAVLCALDDAVKQGLSFRERNDGLFSCHAK